MKKAVRKIHSNPGKGYGSRLGLSYLGTARFACDLSLTNPVKGRHELGYCITLELGSGEKRRGRGKDKETTGEVRYRSDGA